uniref:Aminotransferase-like plant mobile domain-containing protein n=1 Tax=Fagus sylvatica TaxID=28930 RepID=A0A2N9FHP8_FAGSY
MASSSSKAPVGPSPQPSTGEGLEAPLAVPAASTEAMVDAPVASPPVPGESVSAPPSSVSGEAEDLRERSVDFSFPVEDWDWTVSGLEPTVDQAWVPNLDEISELLIQKGDLQATPINFDFLCAASKDWSHWVDREILDPDFWDRLVDAGVHWSILISRSCNMFRDTESLRELLRRWCPSTHTFFFSWGELTHTLEDVANHWMLPIPGEHSFSDVKLSAEEEEVAAALRKRASTRLSGWPAHFSQLEGASVRRAAFVLYWLCKCTFGNFPCYSINVAFIPLAIRISTGHCFPLAPLFLGHLYSQLDLLHDCEIQGDSCYILFAAFNTSVLQTFFWEHSASYIFAARDKSAAWSRFSDLPREFLEQFPDFRDNLPLVYRWVGLKTHDHDLVDALDYEENVLFRPYGDDHPSFTCASIFRKFYGPSPLIRDLKVDDYRSLSYLSTVSPGFLPVLSATGVYFIPYCPQRVQRQFGLDQGIPIGPQETGTCVADLTAFLKSRAFARWGGETTRVLIPGGHRLGFNTPSMGAYWQRFTQSMVDFVIAGRSDKTPMSVHRKASVSNPYLAPPSQSAISYANSQKLGFAEWDASRGGWIAYTIHLPEGWRNSVNVVEDRLIMLSKRGKVNKRDAPVDPAIEKTPKKATPSVLLPRKSLPQPVCKNQLSLATAPPKRKTRAGKESKSTPSVPSAAEESTMAPLEEPAESTDGPSKKVKAGKKSKSTAPVASAVKESTTAPVEVPTESTVAPSKPKSVSASSPRQISKKGAASRPPRSQKKTNVSSSSTGEDEPSAASTPSPPKKKKFTAPLFPLGAAGRTRSKSGPKVTHGSGRSGGGVVDVEDSDVADDDVIASPVRKDAPQAAAVDQDEDMGKSAAGSSEAGDESIGEEHFSSSDSLFDSTPGSLPEDQIVSARSTADDDDMSEADDSSMGAAGSTEEELAIVPYAGHDDDSAVDADVDPISFSLPQTVPTRAGSDVSIAHVMEGISLFGVTPSLRAIPAGGFVIPASHLTSEDSPVVGGALMPEETHAQSLVESGSVVDLGVDAASHDAPIEDAGISAVDTLAGSDHLENIGVDDAVHVSEEIDEVGITGEVTVVSPPRRPTVEAGSSIGVGSLSGEVADFLKEFDAKAPNPHPEQYFWSFNGPLVPFVGLGGPMLSLLGSVLAAMDESSLEDVTKTQILAWRSVIQDLMDVGFDLGFMIERLRQTAQCLFGKRIADEIKALQHQIALL